MKVISGCTVGIGKVEVETRFFFYDFRNILNIVKRFGYFGMENGEWTNCFVTFGLTGKKCLNHFDSYYTRDASQM